MFASFPENQAGGEKTPAFSTVFWGPLKATFLPALSALSARPPPPDLSEEGILPDHVPVTAALVFAIREEKFLVADIIGRGWCIPSGGLEAGETPEQAARREAMEEAGATLGPLTLLGHYLIEHETRGTRSLAATYLAEALELQSPTMPSESSGVCLLNYDELSTHYFLWDELVPSVFRLAWSVWELRETSSKNAFCR